MTFRVLDLFAGLRGWSQAALDMGLEVFTVDLDPAFDVDLHADIRFLRPADLPWRPNLVLASPPCELFSCLNLGKNWHGPDWNPPHAPKNRRAAEAQNLVRRTLRLVERLSPDFWVMENPRAKLRVLPFMRRLPRVTVTYCQYGEPFMKPTDLWGHFPPEWKPRRPCRNGDPCHISAARGSTTGIQGLGTIREAGHPNRVIVDGRDVSRRTLHKRVVRMGYGAESSRRIALTEQGLQEYRSAAHARADREGRKLSKHAHDRADVYGSWDKATLAALRAKVPYELGKEVTEAALASLRA